ncbi:MAG: hypothetical protein BRD49_02365 [Bacteroidetes bacterium SW_10_40_5]|nr:MAG: hypothetical protein BRD49_02365 [Bacteroidetes bacterium SW_10_40_5]
MEITNHDEQFAHYVTHHLYELNEHEIDKFLEQEHAKVLNKLKESASCIKLLSKYYSSKLHAS